MRYSILDPTGNITALVESDVEPDLQPQTAAGLMRSHPAVEQVGFMRMSSAEPGVQAEVRMAGGEFCGNASMSAAALYLLRRGGETETVRLRMSGARLPVELRLHRETADSVRAAVCMPRALAIGMRAFTFRTLVGQLTLVRLEGIAHVIVRETSPFFALLKDRPAAEEALRLWCGELAAECLGLMFLEGDGPELKLTPLVYVPGSATMVWESSCASGSAAVGMALAREKGGPVSLTLLEPGGSLCVESDPATGETWLTGTTQLLQSVEE